MPLLIFTLCDEQGAAEALYYISQRLGMNILPYIVLLVIPLLGRMSDFDNDVRRIVSAIFASLLRIMPLEQGLPDPPGLAAALVEQKQRYIHTNLFVCMPMHACLE